MRRAVLIYRQLQMSDVSAEDGGKQELRIILANGIETGEDEDEAELVGCEEVV